MVKQVQLVAWYWTLAVLNRMTYIELEFPCNAWLSAPR
jgi:hypothetical protein